ncbi:FtsB family cell division protein [Mobilicoccus caccae]|uniref:FtsB family cell division protein n=1 Tax=Mobilicoccus caccae TaxID=1859295 RepID=UPI0024E0AAD6|nr:septum formation initiator family protein [Mobilicoccus caccae]
MFVLLAVMLVPPLRAYLVQQQEYRDLQTSVASQQSRVAELQQRKQQWQDPAYIEQQSRERLRYVRPGETSYVVVGAESLRDQTPRGSLSVIDPATGDGPQAWYSRIWESVETGDTMGTDPAGAPVSRLDGGTESEPSDVTTGAPTEPPRIP